MVWPTLEDKDPQGIFLDSIILTRPAKDYRYKYVFINHYTKTFPWAINLKKGSSYIFCKNCYCDIGFGLDGIKDIRQHEQINLHSQSDRAASG